MSDSFISWVCISWNSQFLSWTCIPDGTNNSWPQTQEKKCRAKKTLGLCLVFLQRLLHGVACSNLPRTLALLCIPVRHALFQDKPIGLRACRAFRRAGIYSAQGVQTQRRWSCQPCYHPTMCSYSLHRQGAVTQKMVPAPYSKPAVLLVVLMLYLGHF